MPDRSLSGNQNERCIKEAVCIHTGKIYDTCRDRDCVENARVYLTCTSQQILDRAINVKPGKAELLWTYIDVEPVPFNRGFYTVDVKYFYKVTADAFCGIGRPREISGLATFDKRAILFGSEGNTKIFSSKTAIDSLDEQILAKSNMPTAVVEAVDPILLDVKLVEACSICNDCCAVEDIPERICRCFEEEFASVSGDDRRQLYATLGQFSLIRLERDSQLLIPAYDYCMPEKECEDSKDESPCDTFRRIRFPTDEFFPPASVCQLNGDNCGCR